MPDRRTIHVDALQPGSVFAGKYEVLANLGGESGGFVYKVRDTALGRVLTLRLSAVHQARGPRFVQDLRRELLLDRSAAHENVERIYAVGEQDGLLFVVSEFVEGVSLARRLNERGTFTVPEFLPLFRQVCAGLASIHSTGAAHGNLSPRTVMLAGSGTVKLTGAGLGDPPSSQAGDVRAAGAVFFEMLAGITPPARPGAVPDVRNHARNVPDDLAGVIRRCLDPDERTRLANGRALFEAAMGLGMSAPAEPAGTLADLAAEGPADLEQVVPVLARVVESVMAMHAGGQPHRGISPGRIRFRGGKVEIEALPAGSMQNTVAAEPKYCPPEMFQESGADSHEAQMAGDIYVLGFAFYEVLAGRRLFQSQFAELGAAPDAFQWLRWQADPQKTLRPLHEVVPSVPAPLSELIGRMTEKDPRRRASSLAELRDALAKIENRVVDTQQIKLQPVTPEAPGARPRRRGRFVAAALTVAVIAGLAAAGWYWWPELRGWIPGAWRQEIAQRSGTPGALDTPTGRMVLLRAPSGTEFYIDEHEITNWQYRKFCDDTGRACGSDAYSAALEYPVRNIPEEAFRAYAGWAGKRVPSLAEAQQAASRFDSRRYPWEPPPRRAGVPEPWAASGFRCAADPPAALALEARARR